MRVHTDNSAWHVPGSIPERRRNSYDPEYKVRNEDTGSLSLAGALLCTRDCGWIGRETAGYLKRDVEMQVRLVDQSHNGSSVSTVSQASSRASVAVRKGDKHSSKKLHRQEAAEKQDDDDGSQLTVRCVGV